MLLPLPLVSLYFSFLMFACVKKRMFAPKNVELRLEVFAHLFSVSMSLPAVTSLTKQPTPAASTVSKLRDSRGKRVHTHPGLQGPLRCVCADVNGCCYLTTWKSLVVPVWFHWSAGTADVLCLGLCNLVNCIWTLG